MSTTNLHILTDEQMQECALRVDWNTFAVLYFEDGVDGEPLFLSVN